MDGTGRHPLSGLEGLGDARIVKTAHFEVVPDALAEELADRFGPERLALLAFFLSPEEDIARVSAILNRAFPNVPVIGCTTAGEIGPGGYSEGGLVVIGLPRAHFVAETMIVADLDRIDPQDIVPRLIKARSNLTVKESGWAHEFAFLLVDGMSMREDELASALRGGLGPVTLFGGSAGDGIDFGKTYVSHRGTIMSHAAVVTLVRTECPVKVFSLDHLTPTEARMVVTKADPKNRLVRSINAEPAAREYARILGKDPEQLTTFTFAAHPVVVRFGDQHHVRAIQRVAENGDLMFFSAIDEGLVLSLANPEDMVAHLDRELSALSANGAPASILACDCILRRLEAEQKQMTRGISDVLSRHRVTGFSTYGEQIGGMHVNQTMTGVAIYPPGHRER